MLMFAVVSVTSFKCYVCSPDSGRPEDMYTLRKSFPTHAIQPCSAYTRHNKHQYLLECPHGGNNGCLTKFAGEYHYSYQLDMWLVHRGCPDSFVHGFTLLLFQLMGL